jgi:hypothetical protein
VFLLAEKTGWSIDYILWSIPLVILYQANHVWLWMNGVKLKRKNQNSCGNKKDLEKFLGI